MPDQAPEASQEVVLVEDQVTMDESLFPTEEGLAVRDMTGAERDMTGAETGSERSLMSPGLLSAHAANRRAMSGEKRRSRKRRRRAR